MIWFVIGAILGAVQLGLPLVRKQRRTEMPLLFVGVGAILGALVYGSIMWAIATYIFGL